MPTRPLVTSYQQSLKLFPDNWHVAGLLAFTFLALYFPFYVGQEWLVIGNITMVAVVGSIALMLLTGFAGQISLGHSAFLAVGAYTAGLMGTHFSLPFWLLLPAAGLVAALVGLLVGVFALRLKGLYLAIVTIGLIFIVRHVITSFDEYTKSFAGLEVPVITWFGTSPEAIYEAWELGPLTIAYEQKIYFFFLITAILIAWLAKNIQRSNAGRAMMAVRDHDLAAAALGVNPAKAKIMAFGLSSFVAGIAGAMFGMQQQLITVDPFHLPMSVDYIAMIVLGGIGTVFGAIAGAIAFTIIKPLSEDFAELIPYLQDLSSSQQSTLIFSVLVIIFLVLEPLGLFGIWLRIKRYFLAWPFRY